MMEKLKETLEHIKSELAPFCTGTCSQCPLWGRTYDCLVLTVNRSITNIKKEEKQKGKEND